MSKEKALEYLENHKKFIGHPTHAGGMGQVAITIEDAIKAIEIALIDTILNPPAGYKLMRQCKTIVQPLDLLYYSGRWNKARGLIESISPYPICRPI